MRFAARPVGSTPSPTVHLRSHPRSTDRCASRVASAVVVVASAPTPTDSPSLFLARVLLVDPLDRWSRIFRCLLASISALLVESCRVDVMDPIRLTRDPNSTRVLDPLDRKIRRNRVCSNREGGIGTRNCFARSFAGTLRRRGKVLRCRSALRCSRKMGRGGRCWLGFNLCAAQPKALLVVAG